MLLLDRKCKICGFDDLNVLCVHHIDGNRKNNDISNLEILCANCHFKMHFGMGKTRRKKVDQIVKYQEKVNAFKERFFKSRHRI
jgi:5-methylcytosine-specific restriction endonuclease McrA